MTHPESGVLAEFQAGLVTGRRRASIASHLAGCGRCAGLSDQLGEIPALLAAAPPLAMPDDVARRLDLVLAAEAAKRDSSERAVDDSPARNSASAPDSGWVIWPSRLASGALLRRRLAGLAACGGGPSSLVPRSSVQAPPRPSGPPCRSRVSSLRR